MRKSIDMIALKYLSPLRTRVSVVLRMYSSTQISCSTSLYRRRNSNWSKASTTLLTWFNRTSCRSSIWMSISTRVTEVDSNHNWIRTMGYLKIHKTMRSCSWRRCRILRACLCIRRTNAVLTWRGRTLSYFCSSNHRLTCVRWMAFRHKSCHSLNTYSTPRNPNRWDKDLTTSHHRESRPIKTNYKFAHSVIASVQFASKVYSSLMSTSVWWTATTSTTASA